MREQLALITQDYGVRIEVRRSAQEIPFAYVLDGSQGAAMGGITPQQLALHFPTTELAMIGDELADGFDITETNGTFPLSLFDGSRTDCSLARLATYTGTPPEAFPRYALVTHYHRLVHKFI